MIEIVSGLAEGRSGENWLEGECGKFPEGKNYTLMGVVVVSIYFNQKSMRT